MNHDLISELKSVVGGLSAKEKEKLVNKLKAKKDLVQMQKPFVLSKIQELFYFHHQFQPLLCNIPAAILIDGPLHVQSAERALFNIVQRHDTLRMKIFIQDNGIYQLPINDLNFKLNQIDLSAIPESMYDNELRMVMQAEFKRPFDLARPPLIRCSVIKRSDTRHVLTLCIHHIVADGWSLNVLLNELIREYEAIKSNKSSEIKKNSFQYREFVEWENQPEQRQEVNRQLEYWKKTLKDAPQIFELPTDFPRPEHRSGLGNTKTYSLSLALSKKIYQFCQKNDITLFMFMLSVYAFILYRYSGKNDLLIGTPISLRNLPQTEKLIGVFLNMIIFRIQFSEKINFSDLIKQVRDIALDSYQHAQCPLSEIISALRPAHVPGFSSLFQVFITHNNAPVKPIQCHDLIFTPMLDEAGGADADLGFFYLDAKEEIALRIEYATDLFKSNTIDYLLKNIECAITCFLSRPEEGLSKVGIVSIEEYYRLQNFSAAADAEQPIHVPGDDCFYLINKCIKQYPHRVILTDCNFKITYQKLPYAVRLMQEKFYTFHCSPGSLIGVCLDNSVEAVLALLAIFSCGATYVPIDIYSTAERINQILVDTACVAIITNEEYAKNLSNYTGILVFIDQFKECWQQYKIPKKNILLTLHDYQNDEIAFLIYTSGSTGQPKASMNTHLALSRKLAWQTHEYIGTLEDQAVGTCSLSFDVSIWEMLSALACNITLHMLPSEIRRDPNSLADYIHANQISLFYIVPSVLKLLLDNDKFCQSEWLHTVICLGEALSQDLVQLFYLTFAQAKLYNYYGPSEACIFATAKYCAPQEKSQRVSIGSPIAANEILILNTAKQLQPIGVPGEIHIAGCGIAKGYLNRPELTQKKFLHLPKYDANVYCTGDAGRWLSHGEIEFLGRFDHQIKFNGIRIELEEIEFYLEKHPYVQQAVVVIREDYEDCKQLHAFITITQSMDSTDLRKFLGKYLLSSVIPHHYHFLRNIPLNINDKKDRVKLAKIPLTEITTACQEDIKLQHVDILQNYFYVPSWQSYSVPIASPVPKFCDMTAVWVIIDTHQALSEKKIEQLTKNNQSYLYVNLKEMQEKSFEKFMSELTSLERACYFFIPSIPDYIGDLSDIQEQLSYVTMIEEFIFSDLFSFLKQCFSLLSKQKIILYAVTENIYNIHETQQIKIPLQSLLMSLLTGISHEFPQVSYKILDVSFDEMMSQFENYLNYLVTLPENKFIAYHRGNTWAPVYQKSPIPSFVDGSCALAHGDTYLIIGFGAIAIYLAEYLVRTVNCSLIIVSKQEKDATCFEHIRNKARHFSFIRADITDYSSVENLFHYFAEQSISINGIISTAGLFSAATLRQTTYESIRDILSPKVQGAIILKNRIQNLPLKFCYTFSSSTTINYTIGTFAYYTANAFMDYYVRQCAASMNMRNIKWGMWRDLGMSDVNRILNPNEEFYQYRAHFSLSAEQGVAAFQRALACHCPELLITPEPIFSISSEQKESIHDSVSNTPKEIVVIPDNEKVKGLIAIWHEVLRVPDIQIHDSFFELGGHSLMATVLINKVNKAFGSQLKMQDLFQYPTIAGLLEFL